MHFDEIDWRLGSTKRILDALSLALARVKQDATEATEDYEFDWAIEHCESLLGIAFVTAQTYINGTIADANRIIRPRKLSKEQLVKEFGEQLPGSVVRKVELCDAIANYFKHHDEWGNWLSVGRHQRTTSILLAGGINESEEFPCRKAADILWSNNDGSNLKPLVTILASWRAEVIPFCTNL
jgi:hypothetical protein